MVMRAWTIALVSGAAQTKYFFERLILWLITCHALLPDILYSNLPRLEAKVEFHLNTALPAGANAVLRLYLGTTFNVKNIIFQQQVDGVWTNIHQVEPVNSLTLNYTAPVNRGINLYRAIFSIVHHHQVYTFCKI